MSKWKQESVEKNTYPTTTDVGFGIVTLGLGFIGDYLTGNMKDSYTVTYKNDQGQTITVNAPTIEEAQKLASKKM